MLCTLSSKADEERRVNTGTKEGARLFYRAHETASRSINILAAHASLTVVH